MRLPRVCPWHYTRRPDEFQRWDARATGSSAVSTFLIDPTPTRRLLSNDFPVRSNPKAKSRLDSRRAATRQPARTAFENAPGGFQAATRGSEIPADSPEIVKTFTTASSASRSIVGPTARSDTRDRCRREPLERVFLVEIEFPFRALATPVHASKSPGLGHLIGHSRERESVVNRGVQGRNPGGKERKAVNKGEKAARCRRSN